MSAYPPPPPGYDPRYAAGSWKAQRRAIKAQVRAARSQAKLQRAQWRAERRSLRRGSLVGPLVLLGLGIVLLLEQMGRLSWAQSLEWYARWWPAVLIIAGVILLAEWALDQQRQETTGVRGGPRVLGSGVVFLLILLAIVGWSARWTDNGVEWKNHYLGNDFGGLDRMFGEAHDADDALSGSIAPNAPLTIHDPLGTVVVTGSSQDGQVHVSVHKQVYTVRDSLAFQRLDKLQPTLTAHGGGLLLDVPALEQGHCDLTVEVPRQTLLSIDAGHGDVTVSQIHAPVTVSSHSGDLELSGIDGSVTVQVNDDNSSVTAHSIAGSLTVQGRGGDLTVSEVDGPVTLTGYFFGTTHVERINGPIRFETDRTQLQLARLDGEMDLDSNDLQLSRVLGPLALTTRDKTVQVDDVSGPLQIRNRDGSVSVTAAAPLGSVEITDQHGSVDLGVPENAAFELNAEARNGDLENEFGLATGGTDSTKQLNGTVGRSGGPQVRVTTSDGDVTVRKSSAPAVPATPPAPLKVTMTPPAAPEAPAIPGERAAKHGHKAPQPAKAPAVSAAPPIRPAAPAAATAPASSGPALL